MEVFGFELKSHIFMNYEYKKIKLSDIILYDENPRFEKAFSEAEAIQKVVQAQDDKLVRLAEHIIDYGFNPTDIPIVFKIGEKFIVKEGNRRIASLMIVNNPNLVFSNEALKNKFLLLKSQKGHLLPERVLCAVFKNPHDADEWVKLKHAVNTEGVGTEKWNSQQANRFAKGNIEDLPIELQAIEILKKGKKTSKTTIDLIPTLKATNLRRLLSDPYVRNKIGLRNYENKLTLPNSKNKSLRNLEAVVQEISQANFVVDEIYHKNDRKKFIDSLKLAKIKLPKTPAFLKAEKIGKKSKEPSTYTSLIDSDKTPPSKAGLKIPKIYKELQIVSVDVAPHASAFLLRVLFEISVKNYLKKKKVLIDKYDCAVVTISGKTTKYDSLRKKINYIATAYISDNDLRSSVSLLNKNSFTTTLNQFVHNELYQATSTSVRDFWTNAEPLFDFLTS